MSILLSLLPLAIFRISYFFTDLFTSLVIALSSSLILLLWRCLHKQKISIFSLLPILILATFCLLYLYKPNTSYLTHGTTYVALFCAMIFGLSMTNHVPKLTADIQEALSCFSARVRRKIFKNCAIIYLLTALMNEIVWRTQSEIFWVEFRTFILMPVLMFATASQILYFGWKHEIVLKQ